MKSMAICALLGIVAMGAGAITPYEQTTTETGVDSGGFPWSDSCIVRASPYPATVSVSTHACGPVTFTFYESQLKYNSQCVAEDCLQSYLDDVLNGNEGMSKCAVNDSACCSNAFDWLTHCLLYPNADCLN
jgi:hypothetical protein